MPGGLRPTIGSGIRRRRRLVIPGDAWLRLVSGTTYRMTDDIAESDARFVQSGGFWRLSDDPIGTGGLVMTGGFWTIYG